MFEDEQNIKEMVQAQQAAWNRGDAHGYADACDDAVTFTSILGVTQFGRTAFIDRHAQLFQTIFKNSKLRTQIQRIHFPAPNIAVVDLAAEVTAYAALPQGVNSRPEGVLRTALLEVLVRAGADWRVVAYHNVDLKTETPSIS